MVQPQYLTTAEVATIARVTELTVWRWVRSGRLPARKVGRRWLIRPGDLQAFIEGGETPSEGDGHA